MAEGTDEKFTQVAAKANCKISTADLRRYTRIKYVISATIDWERLPITLASKPRLKCSD